MAFQFRKTFPLQVGKDTRPVKAPDYFGFIHELPCIITKSTPIEAAHVNYPNKAAGAFGRGLSGKASDRWCLPLSPAMHRAQHDMNEKRFWEIHNIDPHFACLVLWGLYCERGYNAVAIAQSLICEDRFLLPS